MIPIKNYPVGLTEMTPIYIWLFVFERLQYKLQNEGSNMHGEILKYI